MILFPFAQKYCYKLNNKSEKELKKTLQCKIQTSILYAQIDKVFHNPNGTKPTTGYVLTKLNDSHNSFYCFINQAACQEYQNSKGGPLSISSKDDYINITITGIIFVKKSKLQNIEQTSKSIPSLQPYKAEESDIHKSPNKLVPVFRTDKCLFIMSSSKPPSQKSLKKIPSIKPIKKHQKMNSIALERKVMNQFLIPDINIEFDIDLRKQKQKEIPIIVPTKSVKGIQLSVYSFSNGE